MVAACMKRHFEKPFNGLQNRPYLYESGPPGSVKAPRGSAYVGAGQEGPPSSAVPIPAVGTPAPGRKTNGYIQVARNVVYPENYFTTLRHLQTGDLAFINAEKQPMVGTRIGKNYERTVHLATLRMVNAELALHPRSAAGGTLAANAGFKTNTLFFDWRNVGWRAASIGLDGKPRGAAGLNPRVWDGAKPRSVRDAEAGSTSRWPDALGAEATPEDAELLDVLDAWRLDGVVMSTDDAVCNDGSIGNTNMLYNMCIEGHVSTNNNARNLMAGGFRTGTYANDQIFDPECSVLDTFYVALCYDHTDPDDSTSSCIFKYRCISSGRMDMPQLATDDDAQTIMRTMVGAWQVGKVADSREGRIATPDGGVSGFSDQVRLKVAIRWCTLQFMYERFLKHARMRQPGYGSVWLWILESNHHHVGVLSLPSYDAVLDLRAWKQTFPAHGHGSGLPSVNRTLTGYERIIDAQQVRLEGVEETLTSLENAPDSGMAFRKSLADKAKAEMTQQPLELKTLKEADEKMKREIDAARERAKVASQKVKDARQIRLDAEKLLQRNAVHLQLHEKMLQDATAANDYAEMAKQATELSAIRARREGDGTTKGLLTKAAEARQELSNAQAVLIAVRRDNNAILLPMVEKYTEEIGSLYHAASARLMNWLEERGRAVRDRVHMARKEIDDSSTERVGEELLATNMEALRKIWHVGSSFITPRTYPDAQTVADAATAWWKFIFPMGTRARQTTVNRIARELGEHGLDPKALGETKLLFISPAQNETIKKTKRRGSLVKYTQEYWNAPVTVDDVINMFLIVYSNIRKGDPPIRSELQAKSKRPKPGPGDDPGLTIASGPPSGGANFLASASALAAYVSVDEEMESTITQDRDPAYTAAIKALAQAEPHPSAHGRSSGECADRAGALYSLCALITGGLPVEEGAEMDVSHPPPGRIFDQPRSRDLQPEPAIPSPMDVTAPEPAPAPAPSPARAPAPAPAPSPAPSPARAPAPGSMPPPAARPKNTSGRAPAAAAATNPTSASQSPQSSSSDSQYVHVEPHPSAHASGQSSSSNASNASSADEAEGDTGGSRAGRTPSQGTTRIRATRSRASDPAP